MAYTIRNDATNAIVYDPRIDDAVLIDPVLHQKDNQFSSFNCEMYANHFDSVNLRKRRTIYAIYKDDATQPMWKGILISGGETLNPSMELYFEDFMSVLRDSMQDAFVFTGRPDEFLAQLIANHNAQVEPWQRITLGVVSVTDPNDYIRRSSESELSTWEVIKTRLIDALGGHLRMRYVNGMAYLDYLEGGTTNLDQNFNTSTQVIEFGENLKEFSRVVSASETYTACIPKGAKIDKYDENGELYSESLSIADVNDGSKYLIDADAVALYGFRCAPISETTWSDVTVAANLKTKGLEWLQGKAVKLANTIKLSAIDLRHLGVTSDSFDFLNYVRVNILPYDIDAIYLLTEISIPLDNPSELTIGLGETFRSLADRQQQQVVNFQQKIESTIQDVKIDVNNSTLNEISRNKNSIETYISENNDQILQRVSNTYTSTSAFEEYQKTVTSTFEQTSEGFDLRFETEENSRKQLEEGISNQFRKIDKYIRFVDGNILLGEDGNPLILEIRNDRILFKYNNVEIAYFSSGKLYVDKLEAITSLTLGAFAFSPDSSGGMALKHIGV